MLMRFSFLLMAFCFLAGCKAPGNSTAMAASELAFSPEPAVRPGNMRIRPKLVREDADSIEWEWRLKGAGLPGGAKFYDHRMPGEGPISLTMKISGSIQFDGRVHLIVRQSGSQVTAVQRVELSTGKAGKPKIQEKSWTFPGLLKDAVKVERAKVIELEMPFRTTLAKVGGKEIDLDFQQSQF